MNSRLPHCGQGYGGTGPGVLPSATGGGTRAAARGGVFGPAELQWLARTAVTGIIVALAIQGDVWRYDAAACRKRQRCCPFVQTLLGYATTTFPRLRSAAQREAHCRSMPDSRSSSLGCCAIAPCVPSITSTTGRRWVQGGVEHGANGAARSRRLRTALWPR